MSREGSVASQFSMNLELGCGVLKGRYLFFVFLCVSLISQVGSFSLV